MDVTSTNCAVKRSDATALRWAVVSSLVRVKALVACSDERAPRGPSPPEEWTSPDAKAESPQSSAKVTLCWSAASSNVLGVTGSHRQVQPLRLPSCLPARLAQDYEPDERPRFQSEPRPRRLLLHLHKNLPIPEA